MRFFVLASDYDGTIAHHGVMDDATLKAAAEVRASGRKLLLVTGRELSDLKTVCPDFTIFDAIVAENGALVHHPATHQTRLLAEPPPPAFVEALRAAGVGPISVGQVIVATWQPHEKTVLDTIRDLGLELQVIFNKGAVMVLPTGVNKAVGLRAALDDLGLSPHNAVGVGDAENDHAFLSVCECAVAVANALPSLKERADWVTTGDHGLGVQELAAALAKDDLRSVVERLDRHGLELGQTGDGSPVRIPPFGPPVLLAGSSGGGKSTLTTAFFEQLTTRGYQFCIIDPEGDYLELPGLTVLGSHDHAPTPQEVVDLLTAPSRNAVVNLTGVALGDRPAFFETLLPHLQQLRAQVGRPHWLIIDEVHHLLPPGRSGVSNLPKAGVLAVTVHPDHVARPLLEEVSTVILVGKSPRDSLRAFTDTIGMPAPEIPAEPLPPGEAVVWFRGTSTPPVRFRSHPPQAERRRHLRKYAAGDLGVDRSFFFKGPMGKLNLRVQNLQLFIQTAEGVDDETWMFHLQRGDYSRWFKDAIKDPDLAAEAEEVERSQTQENSPPPSHSRSRIRAAIEKRYTAAA
jgi:hydroxymethylpyrimidine pyrophosphatase-like HAD family hydrolase